MTPPDSDLPARSSRLDRAAVERVLARAAELQVAGSGDEPEGELTEAQLVELGREVGLSPDHIRQALAEERTRLPDATPERGMGRSLLGPGHVAAQRTVPGTPRDVLAEIDAWMQREECLQVRRQFPDRITWEARRDLFGTVRRALSLGRDYSLSRAGEVGATVVPVDEKKVLVRLEADLRPYRASVARQGSGLGALGAVGAGAMAVMHFALPVLIVPVAVGAAAGYLGARELHQRLASRAQLALEQLLDRLERGELARQPSLLRAIADVAASLPTRKY